MKAWLVAILAALVVMVASAASATSLTCRITTAGSLSTYTYTLTSTEYGDYITSMHVYALLDLGLIKSTTGPTNWLFDAIVDPDPEVGADIYWYADDYDTHGIGNLAVKQFSLTVPSTCTVDNNHIVPGCFGNWGYETQSWPGDVMISFGCVPVPKGVAAAAPIPEPTSLMILAAGCALLPKMRRRRKN